jgi:hypothetical protein
LEVKKKFFLGGRTMYIVEASKKELKQNLLRAANFLTSKTSEDEDRTTFIILNTLHSRSLYIDSAAYERDEVVEMDYCEFESIAVLKSQEDIVATKLTTEKVNQILSFINSSVNDDDKVVVIISPNYLLLCIGDNNLKLSRY